MRHAFSHCRGLYRAFTLLELTVVCVIIATISAIAMPRYANSMARYRVERAARRLAADLELAKANARVTSQDTRVTFNTSADTYAAAGVRGFGASTADLLVKLKADPHFCDLYSVSANGTTYVQFDRYGAPSSAATIVLKCGSRAAATVSVATSGQIAVQ